MQSLNQGENTFNFEIGTYILQGERKKLKKPIALVKRDSVVKNEIHSHIVTVYREMIEFTKRPKHVRRTK